MSPRLTRAVDRAHLARWLLRRAGAGWKDALVDVRIPARDWLGREAR